MGEVVRLMRTEVHVPREGVIRLTKRAVEGLKADPSGAERFLWDSELKGFGVRVMPSGRRSYLVQYRDLGGRTRRITLGRHGTLTADQARCLAVQRLGEVARGENPAAARKAARVKAKQTGTVSELIDRFMREHVEAKRKPRTVESYRRLLDERVRPPLGDLAVDAVTRVDIEALHSRLRATPTEANRTVAALSSMFSRAEAWGLRPLQSNPCYRLERYPERRRDRFFSDNELQRIGGVLAEAEQARTMSDGAITALRLLALTGCRASEVLGLLWSEIDLDAGVLRLPDAKAGARAVPLGEPAIALLRGLPRVGEHVITGRNPGTRLTLSGLEKAWAKTRTSAKLHNARLHDLRHTVGTYAGQAGLNAFTVRDILGHKTLAMTDIYVSHDITPLRRAADQVAGRVADAMAGKQVVPAQSAPHDR